jgi:N-hydroxyarylamine O-acetyltransferase
VIDRYLARVGLDGSDRAVTTLQRAHVRGIPYENLDVLLRREIVLDPEHLVAKMVDRHRGGYCYEQNTLFATVLEQLGHTVTRCLGRVRYTDQTSPRPATHMVLLVDGAVVDVGFGTTTPLGPVPLGGEATYEGWTWSTSRVSTPEGEEAWLVSRGDAPLYTFTDAPRHPVDYVTANHFSSTHPRSHFTYLLQVQHWEGDVQVGLLGEQLVERRPGEPEVFTPVAPGELASLLRDRFGLDVDDDEVARLALL